MPKLPTPSFGTVQPLIGRLDVICARAGKAVAERRWMDAIQLYQQAARIDPTSVAVTNDLAVAYAEAGDLTNALYHFENSLRLDPDQAAAWLNRGELLSRLGRLAEAGVCFDRVIALRPDHERGYLHRADTLCRMGRFEEAAASYRKMAASLPDDQSIAINHAIALQWCRRFDESAREFDRAIALNPDNPMARVDKAFLLMLLGDLPAGQRLYERRWLHGDMARNRPVGQPLWLGEPGIAGKTILLYWEQGLGDTIQFCRYAPMVAALGARVLLQVNDPLAELMAGLDGVAEIVGQWDTPPAHDLRCPLMSLPLAFGTTEATIPASIPYLRADPTRAAAWKARLSGLPGRRIGLVWAGSARLGIADLVATDQRRSLPLAALAPLASVPGCSFVSLQLGEASRQTAPGLAPLDVSAELKSFADTAALIENLDLVIGVDTSTPHLAGAMGKPVWLLNRFDTCWRWFVDRDDTPWYPTMRLFNQPAAGDWDSVIRSVTEALRRFAA